MSAAAVCAVALLLCALPATGKLVRGHPVAPATWHLPPVLTEISSQKTTPFSGPGLTTRQEAPPNIVFILSDDLGYGDYSISGAADSKHQIPTPNIQRLADNGMKFMRGYSGPVCAPSRCTLMTGRHMGRCTIRGNDGSFTPLLPADVTVAEVLRETHTTGIVGKWGLGDFGTTGYPTEQGFDYYVGQDSQLACHDWFPQFVNNNSKQHQALNDKRFLGPGCLAEGGGNCVWANDLVRDEAVTFIRRHANGPKPFFLYVSSTTPHDGQLWNYPADSYPVPMPYTAASFIQPSWPLHIRSFAAAVWAQDLIVGAVLDELAAQNIEENTIVFFSGDNGPDMHDFSFFNDVGPLRGKKRSLHEAGTRQTIAVQWKGRIQPGTSSNHLFAFWDLLPTAADLAGVPKSQWPATEGVSAAALLQGQGEQKEHEYLYWEFCYYGRADGNLPQTYDEGWAQSLRFDESGTEWKGIRVDRGPMQLWNLTADPSESRDLGELPHFKKVVRRMTMMMAEAHVENKHWPSVGEGGAGPRCCDSCYNPQGIGCEPQCVPTQVRVSASALASNDREQEIDSNALVGDWLTESGAAFKINLTGTFATITNVNNPDYCWQEGSGVFDADASRLTAVVGADVKKGCKHHLVGSLSKTTEEVQFDEDYKYHNVTYHIDWATREGKQWPQWSRSVGLEQAQSSARGPPAAPARTAADKTAYKASPAHIFKGDNAQKGASAQKKRKMAPLRVVIAEKEPLQHAPNPAANAAKPSHTVVTTGAVGGSAPAQRAIPTKRARTKAAEKNFAEIASKVAAPETKFEKAMTWVSNARDRLGGRKDEEATRVAKANEDLKEAAEELAREALAAKKDEVRKVADAKTHNAAVAKQAAREWARKAAAAKEEHKINMTAAHAQPSTETASKPSRWVQLARRLRSKIGVVQLNAAVRSPASRV